jgi:hypothetical protein
MGGRASVSVPQASVGASAAPATAQPAPRRNSRRRKKRSESVISLGLMASVRRISIEVLVFYAGYQALDTLGEFRRFQHLASAV